MVPSVYFSFFYLLVSSLSNFHPDTRGQKWSLFRLTCSAVLWGGRNTIKKYHWHGKCSKTRPHWVCPSSGCVHFPNLHFSGSMLLLLVHCLKRALGCMHFPGLSCSGKVLGYSTKAWIRLGLCFVPFSDPSSSGDQVLVVFSPSGECILSPPQSQLLGFLGGSSHACLRCAVCLFLGADLLL